MKRLLALLLALLMAVSLLSGCGGEKKKTFTAETVTCGEDQLAQTGIQLYVPDYTDELTWLVLTDESGRAIPQADFGYLGVVWHFRAEQAAKDAPYNFSDLDGKWTEEGSWGNETVDAELHTDGQRGWGGWIDADGIAYNVFSEKCSMEELMDVVGILADAKDFYNTDPNYVDDGVVTQMELEGFDLFDYLWKYDDADSYLRIFPNKTYYTVDAALDVTSRRCFCAMQEGSDNTLVLYDENGAPAQTLTAEKVGEGDYGVIIVLTDENGRTLSLPADGDVMAAPVPAGSYYCFISSIYYGDGSLVLLEMLDQWFTEEEVAAMKVGGTVTMCEDWMGDVEIGSMEKQADGSYLINGDIRLRYSDEDQLWRWTDPGISWMACVGTALFAKNAEFTDSIDGTHKTLDACIAANDMVYGTVVVKNGEVQSVEVDNAF